MEILQANRISKVSFEAKPNQEFLGCISLYLTHGIYFFEWEPNDETLFQEYLPKETQFRLIIPLSNIKEITRNNESMKTVILSFSFNNKLKASFRFHNFSQAVISQLIEFLLFKKMISASQTMKMKYIVNSVQSNKKDLEVSIQNKFSNFKFINFQQMSFMMAHLRFMKKFQENQNLFNEPLTIEGCLAYFDENGTCKHFNKLKYEIFKRGLNDEARRFIWPFLLNVKSPLKSNEENEQLMNQNLEKYKILCFDICINAKKSEYKC